MLHCDPKSLSRSSAFSVQNVDNHAPRSMTWADLCAKEVAMSHPFGDLLSQYLHRKHGLSQIQIGRGYPAGSFRYRQNVQGDEGSIWLRTSNSVVRVAQPH